MASPLAKKLFSLDGVAQVFFGADFVTVTKKDDFTWPMLKPDIFASIMDHYSSGQTLEHTSIHAPAATDISTNFTEPQAFALACASLASFCTDQGKL